MKKQMFLYFIAQEEIMWIRLLLLWRKLARNRLHAHHVPAQGRCFCCIESGELYWFTSGAEERQWVTQAASTENKHKFSTMSLSICILEIRFWKLFNWLIKKRKTHLILLSGNWTFSLSEILLCDPEGETGH